MSELGLPSQIERIYTHVLYHRNSRLFLGVQDTVHIIRENRPTKVFLLLVGLPSYFLSKLSHFQWAIPQTRDKFSTFKFFPRTMSKLMRKGKDTSNMVPSFLRSNICFQVVFSYSIQPNVVDDCICTNMP